MSVHFTDTNTYLTTLPRSTRDTITSALAEWRNLGPNLAESQFRGKSKGKHQGEWALEWEYHLPGVPI